MTVDRAWVRRNIGIDLPPLHPPNAASVAHEDRQREIIDFDSESPEGRGFLTLSTATGLSQFTPIPWPEKLAPQTDHAARVEKSGALPKADVLVVTWTMDEGHALSRVLTPGKDSRDDYVSYRHNFSTISKKMRPGCPALLANRLGAYWTTTIGGIRVVVFKSDSHLSQDTVKKQPQPGVTLPNEDVWHQIIAEVRPSLVITTGTAGGIGTSCEVGDVVVSRIVRFDAQQWLTHPPYGRAHFSDGEPNSIYFAEASILFEANAGQLPKDNERAPRIDRVKTLDACVVTTDFFGFDTSDDHFGLQGLGDVSEMGDAILGLVMSRLGAQAPDWAAVRNVSDPQIEAEGTLADQANAAATIYKAFGRWSSVCSAIVCWALIAARRV